jgi:hypothetical protein
MAIDPRRTPWARAEVGEERLIFAEILSRGTWISVAVLFLTFVLYIGGLVKPLIPIDQLPQYWGMSAAEYLREASLPRGWGWVRLVAFGDFLNFIGIAMLAGMTIVCYLAVLPIFLRRQDTTYALITLAEIAILLLAASGLLAVGH